MRRVKYMNVRTCEDDGMYDMVELYRKRRRGTLTSAFAINDWYIDVLLGYDYWIPVCDRCGASQKATYVIHAYSIFIIELLNSFIHLFIIHCIFYSILFYSFIHFFYSFMYHLFIFFIRSLFKLFSFYILIYFIHHLYTNLNKSLPWRRGTVRHPGHVTLYDTTENLGPCLEGGQLWGTQDIGFTAKATETLRDDWTLNAVGFSIEPD